MDIRWLVELTLHITNLNEFDRHGRESPRLRSEAVRFVRLDDVVLARLSVAVVVSQPRRGRDRVARPAGRHAPQLRGGAVRAGQHRRPPGLGQQHAARGDPVQARCRVALEGEGAGAGLCFVKRA